MRWARVGLQGAWAGWMGREKRRRGTAGRSIKWMEAPPLQQRCWRRAAGWRWVSVGCMVLAMPCMLHMQEASVLEASAAP